MFLSALGVGIASETDNPNSSNKRGDIVGAVIDNADGKPIEYATVALYKANEELLTGGISDSEGFFRLKNNPVGEYYLTVTFLGYKTITIPNIKILNDTREVDLGRINIEPNVKELKGVDVIADQASVSYKIDKKVVNVSQQLTAKSGTAVDILENIPSVKVDIEGNVSLRGSNSFTVLIDGRPTVLDPSDALSQIPAGAIENIEIITNPSAKYEPDGAAGIINIISKKNKLNGTSGIANINYGRFNNYGVDFTLDNRQEKLHTYIGADYNHRNRPGEIDYSRFVYFPTDTSFVNTLGEFERGGVSSSIKGGLDWNFTPKSIFGIGFRIGQRSMKREMDKDYEAFSASNPNKILYQTYDNWERTGTFYEVNASLRKNFNKKKTHFFEAQFIANSHNGDESSENYKYATNGEIESAKKTTEAGPHGNIRFKLDYTMPFEWGGKMEAGWQSQITSSEDENEVFDYNTISSIYELQNDFSKSTLYTRNTHAAYTTFGGEMGDFGYQAGLRLEYTYRDIELVADNERFTIDRPDYFPTIHFSYKLPAEQQTMVSYTRRINRPRGWFLEPFITYMDANNIRQGNPELQPEYINSFDLSYQKKFKKQNFFSVEAYYRITQNKIERLPTQYEDSVIFLHSYVNASADYALGVEFMLSYNPVKWYSTNLMLDFFDYRIEGTLDDVEYAPNDFSWNSRFNNTFKLNANTRFQLDVMYQSETVRLQGTRSDFFTVSAAYKQDFFKRKMSATLQVRDVLSTWKYGFTLSHDDIYQDTQFTPRSPSVMLSLSYKLNNYRVKRGERGGNGMDEGGEIM